MMDNEIRAHFVGKRIQRETHGTIIRGTIIRMQRDMQLNWVVEYIRDLDGGTSHFSVRYPEYEIEIVSFSPGGKP